MKVLKFGGTSVGTPQNMRRVADLCIRAGKNIVVFSAMSGTTNSLVEISDYLSKGNVPGAQEVLNALEDKYRPVLAELFSKDSDRQAAAERVWKSFELIRSIMGHAFSPVEEREILAQGELMSTAIMERLFLSLGVKVVSLPALNYMRTLESGEPDMAHIAARLKRELDMAPDADLYITQGYICRNSRGEIDNLKRGGSDYSASLIGAVLHVDEIQIWTDIDGMHNNDPRFVEGTTAVGTLHFEEAAELAYFGAKILHPSCVLPAKLSNIPVRLLNTMQPDAAGTLICNTTADGTVKAVAAKDNITAVKIKSGRMLMAYGFLHKVFETFDAFHTPIDMIATSEVGVTVTIDNDSHLAAIVDRLKEFGTVTVDRDMVIICVVGDLEWHNVGIESRAVAALDDIPIRMISYGGSNYNISMLVRREDKVPALRRLSAALFEQ